MFQQYNVQYRIIIKSVRRYVVLWKSVSCSYVNLAFVWINVVDSVTVITQQTFVSFKLFKKNSCPTI